MKLNQGVYVYRGTQSTVRENVASQPAQHLADVVNANENKVTSGESFVSQTGLSICRSPYHLHYHGSGDHDRPFSNPRHVGVNLVPFSFRDLFHHLCRRAMTRVLSQVHYPIVGVLSALRWGRKHPVRTMDLCFGGNLIRCSA